MTGKRRKRQFVGKWLQTFCHHLGGHLGAIKKQPLLIPAGFEVTPTVGHGVPAAYRLPCLLCNTGMLHPEAAGIKRKI